MREKERERERRESGKKYREILRERQTYIKVEIVQMRERVLGREKRRDSERW